jgi:3-deoxy-manno-octulosonate cytidylyltransferase (CMP-KDO synthetase)
MTNPRILVLIPARMASTRLPGKPLLEIAGLPMIVHVLRRAQEAAIGRVAVATDTPEIAKAVVAHGGEVVMTRPDHPSGSDRIFEALGTLDPEGEVEVVVNLQGDFPTILPDQIRDVLAPLDDPAVDIATLAAEIRTEEEALNPNVVKAVGSPIGTRRLRALYFTRATAPWGDGPRYHHIGLYFTRATAPHGDGPRHHHVGLYAYRRAALERFVRLPPSPLELQEKLEQLRALEAGMRIDIMLADTVPRGVDTPADLQSTREMLAKS